MKLVRSSLLMKIVILVLVVYAVFSLVHLRGQITEKEQQAAALTSSILAAEQENSRLREAIEALDTDEGIEAVARDRMDMVSEGEINFFDVNR